MSASGFTSSRTTSLHVDWQRVLALAFPHWTLWAIVLVLLPLDWLLDLHLSTIEISGSAYALVYFNMLAAIPALVWRYLRFEHFDWFTHRAWSVLMLVLWVAASSKAVGFLGYELTALRLPLVSDWLNGTDRALGFDWNAYASAILQNKWSETLFFNAYNDVTDLAIKATFTFALLLNNRMRLLEACFLSTVAGIVTSVVGALLPAYPAFNTVARPEIVDHLYAHGLFSLHGVAEQFTALRTLPLMTVTPDIIVGLVNFPSYHCCVALIVMICCRGLGPVSYLAYLTGVAIIISTPVFGGHYFTDLLGGAGLIGICFAIWHYAIQPRVSASIPGTREGDFEWPKNWQFLQRFSYR